MGKNRNAGRCIITDHAAARLVQRYNASAYELSAAIEAGKHLHLVRQTNMRTLCCALLRDTLVYFVIKGKGNNRSVVTALTHKQAETQLEGTQYAKWAEEIDAEAAKVEAG